MQIEADRQQPQRSLRDRAEEGERREPAHPAAEAGRAVGEDPGGQRERDREERHHAVAELDRRMLADRREERSLLAARPRLARKPRAGQPHGGAGEDDQVERDRGGEREARVALGGQLPPPGACRGRLHGVECRRQPPTWIAPPRTTSSGSGRASRFCVGSPRTATTSAGRLPVEEPRCRDEEIRLLRASAAGERGSRDQCSATPTPSTTCPTRHTKSFRDSNSACNTAPLSAGSETSSPPEV